MSQSDLLREVHGTGHITPPTHGHVPFSRPVTPGLHPLQIGFAGLGAMGYLMARNLAKNGHSQTVGSPPILVWNRTTAKSEKLAQEVGKQLVQVCPSLEELATRCDVVLTNLGDDNAVRSVYVKFSEALNKSHPTKNKIFVEMSTIYPTLAGELDQLLTGIPHTHLITCPVFGAPAAADKAQLILVMSGHYASKKEVAYLLVPAVGRKVVDLGGNLEKAPTMKLIGNATILGMIEVMAEGITLAEKAGVGAKTFENFMKDMLPAPPLVNYCDKMLHDKFDGSVGFNIDGGLKDAAHIRNLSHQHNAPMPTVDLAYQNMLSARAHHSQRKTEGHVATGKNGDFEVLDWSALIVGRRVAAGLDGFHSGHAGAVVEDDS